MPEKYISCSSAIYYYIHMETQKMGIVLSSQSIFRSCFFECLFHGRYGSLDFTIYWFFRSTFFWSRNLLRLYGGPLLYLGIRSSSLHQGWSTSVSLFSLRMRLLRRRWRTPGQGRCTCSARYPAGVSNPTISDPIIASIFSSPFFISVPSGYEGILNLFESSYLLWECIFYVSTFFWNTCPWPSS